MSGNPWLDVGGGAGAGASWSGGGDPWSGGGVFDGFGGFDLFPFGRGRLVGFFFGLSGLPFGGKSGRTGLAPIRSVGKLVGKIGCLPPSPIGGGLKRVVVVAGSELLLICDDASIVLLHVQVCAGAEEERVQVAISRPSKSACICGIFFK